MYAKPFSRCARVKGSRKPCCCLLSPAQPPPFLGAAKQSKKSYVWAQDPPSQGELGDKTSPNELNFVEILHLNPDSYVQSCEMPELSPHWAKSFAYISQHNWNSKCCISNEQPEQKIYIWSLYSVKASLLGKKVEYKYLASKKVGKCKDMEQRERHAAQLGPSPDLSLLNGVKINIKWKTKIA